MELSEFKATLVKLFNTTEGLDLDEVTAGFVMSRDQYNHYTTEIIAKRTACPASYSDAFYPKSSHMVVKERMFSEEVAYSLLAITKEFPYFRWHYGPGMPEEWRAAAPNIQNLTEGPVAFLWYKRPWPFINGKEMLVAIDKNSKKILQSSIHIGGGRLYHEPSAQPYNVEFADKVIL